jgi:hypothetical protein
MRLKDVPTLPCPLGKAICYGVVLGICSAWRKNAEFLPADLFLVPSLSYQDSTLTCWNLHRKRFSMTCKGTLTDDLKSLYLQPITPLLVLSLSRTTSCWLVMFLFVAALTSPPSLQSTMVQISLRRGSFALTSCRLKSYQHSA